MENCFTEEKMDTKKGCKQWLKQRTRLEKTLMSVCAVLFLICTLVILFGISYNGKSSTTTVERTVCSSDTCIETASEMLKKMDPASDPCEDFYEFSCGRYLRTQEIPNDFHERSIEQTTADAIRLEVKNWLESEIKDEDISVYKKAKTLYSTCMNFSLPEDEYSPFLQSVYSEQMLGTWPVLDILWEEKELEQTLAALALLDIPVAFRLDVVPDAEDSSKYIARISPGEPLLDPERFQGKTEKSLITSYTSMVVSAFMMLGLHGSKAVTDFSDILTIERRLVEISKAAKKECGNPSKENSNRNGLVSERVPISKLDQLMPEMDWKKLTQIIFAGLNTSDDTEIELYCHKHIRNYTNYFLLETSSARSTFVYLGWRFLFPFIQYLGQPFNRLHQDYSESITGRVSRTFHSRWKECVSLVEQRMLPVVAAIYGEQEVTKSVKDGVQKMLDSLKASFNHFLSSSSFLGENERNRSKQKVVTIFKEDDTAQTCDRSLISTARWPSSSFSLFTIGKEESMDVLERLPAVYRMDGALNLSRLGFEIALTNYSADIKKVDRMFSQLNLENDHLLLNILRLQRFKVANRLQKLLSPHKEGLEWKQSSLISSKSCQSNDKIISLQYDKVRPPMLLLEQPSYLNYGAFGVFLSHEITHIIGNTDELQALRVTGNDKIYLYYEVFNEAEICEMKQKYSDVATRNKKEKTLLWDLEEKNRKTRCFANQYFRYTIDQIHAEVDGWKTLNENLADNSAMQIAYEAYERHLNSNEQENKLIGLDFTSEQMFFLSFAQMFCQIRDKDGFTEYMNSSFAPSRVRVNAVLSNLQKFGEVYRCAENTPMNPTEKCILW